ncbi:TIGR02556 family CRISPR-associated protein [Calidifontibacillus erzurumensis]|uniref:TIGR02556 family CRISPR-associated protein n=1 Tax=Calidifontibacillus erzurumensis TaxID=2741433 RepID=A0A8J8K9D5_9BACI|nr:TIGR02556 family CRISPR-associated protein [Calidifontibacillus erzurumensis]NSL53031.1 TIGR02556 family CRISPR-associated protein [Calidifontibacillus erzurumensis]
MIENIRYLGKQALKENSSIIENLVLPIPTSKKKQHILIVNFDLNQKKLILESYEVQDSSPIDFIWIGSADASNSPQWYGTVTNIEYLLNQTIPNLIERWDRNDPFYKKLQDVIKHFFLDLKISKKSDERYRFVINPQFLNGKITTDDAKKAKGEVTKLFYDFLQKEKGLKQNDIFAYSLAINGELVVKKPEYQSLVIKEKISVYENNEKGICSITNTEDYITGVTTKLKFNYYINDKINFASNIEEKNFIKNMAIGKKAYQEILAGEAFILRHLDTRFGSTLKCYVIPEFLFEPETNIPFKEWGEIIQQLVNTVKTVEIVENLRRETSSLMRRREKQNLLMLNFLFYVQSQKSLKISKLIENVPISNVVELHNAMIDAEKIGKNYFSSGSWKVGLNQIYYLIPMKEQRGENYEKRKILLVYESLLGKKRLDYQWLIAQLTHLGKVYYYEQFNSYQINEKNADFGLVRAMLQCQLLLSIFNKLNLLKGGNFLMSEKIFFQLDDDVIVDYLTEMRFNQAASSMFLLGVLIAEVGSKQYQERGSKAILHKINYQGMGKRKVQALSVDVFEKLSQYKLLYPNIEKIYAEHKRLFDESLVNWKLSDRETVFYLLSGYSFGTDRKLKFQRNKENLKEPVKN